MKRTALYAAAWLVATAALYALPLLGQTLVMSIDQTIYKPIFDGAASVTGTLNEGDTLSASYAIVEYRDSDVETFQWYRSDDAGGTNRTMISGATGLSYVVTSGDVSNSYYFDVAITAGNVYGQATLTSSRVGPAAGSDTTDPGFDSASVNQAGTQLTAVFDEAITTSATGWSIDCSVSADTTLTVNSGSGTSTIVFDIVTTVVQEGETVDLDYDSGTGDAADLASNTLGTLTSETVSNQSNQGGSSPEYPTGYDSYISDITSALAVMSPIYDERDWDAEPYGGGGTNSWAARQAGEREPWLGLMLWAEHLGGDATLEGHAEDAAVMYLAQYVEHNNYGVVGYQNYTWGFAKIYEDTSTTRFQTAVNNLSTTAAYAKAGQSLSALKLSMPVGDSRDRELNYAAMSFMDAERYGGQSYRAQLQEYMDIMLGDVDDVVTGGGSRGSVTLDEGGHLDQWFGTYTVDSNGDQTGGDHDFDNDYPSTEGYGAFKGAYSAWTAIRYYEDSTQTGTHTGGTNSTVMTDSSATFTTDWHVGQTIVNTTANCSGTITANTPTTVTVGSLTGGARQDWQSSDGYSITGRIDSGTTTIDSRILPKLKLLADATWTLYWVSGDEAMAYRWGDTPAVGNNGAPDLAHVIFPWYAWLYKMTGEARYKTRADAIFYGGRNNASLNNPVPASTSTKGNQKQFNDSIRFTFQGLRWFADGVTLHD